MANCQKTAYVTKAEARKAKRSIRAMYRKASFYKCAFCGEWHITSTRNKLNLQIRDIERQHDFAQAIQSKQAEFIKKLSNKKTVWRVFLGGRGFIVTYNKKSKLCEINHYLGHGSDEIVVGS